MKNCKQLAVEWGLSERTINVLCKKGKIHGAIKVGKSWEISDDVEKPPEWKSFFWKICEEGCKRRKEIFTHRHFRLYPCAG